MAEQNPHEQLQLATEQMQQSMEMIQDAKDAAGKDKQPFENAVSQLKQAEDTLELASDQFGQEVLENPQFQQTMEQIHNLRQQLAKVKRQQNKTY